MARLGYPPADPCLEVVVDRSWEGHGRRLHKKEVLRDWRVGQHRALLGRMESTYYMVSVVVAGVVVNFVMFECLNESFVDFQFSTLAGK